MTTGTKRSPRRKSSGCGFEGSRRRLPIGVKTDSCYASLRLRNASATHTHCIRAKNGCMAEEMDEPLTPQSGHRLDPLPRLKPGGSAVSLRRNYLLVATRAAAPDGLTPTSDGRLRLSWRGPSPVHSVLHSSRDHEPTRTSRIPRCALQATGQSICRHTQSTSGRTGSSDQPSGLPYPPSERRAQG